MKGREYIRPVTRKGQVTIPVAIRELLGLKKTGKVAFEVDQGIVRIRPAQVTLEAAYGAVEPLSRPEDFAQIARIAQEEHAEQVVGQKG